MKVTTRRRFASAGSEQTVRTASAIMVPPLASSASMCARAWRFISGLAGWGVGKRTFAVLPKSTTWKVSFGFMWSRIQRMVSFAFSSGRPACEPERSITKIISLGAAVSGVTCLGGRRTKVT